MQKRQYYHALFNTITDVMDMLEAQEFQEAGEVLMWLDMQGAAATAEEGADIYQRMCAVLFQAVSAAKAHLEAQEHQRALTVLERAGRRCERMFIEEGDWEEDPEP